jgi:hypothetical protein
MASIHVHHLGQAMTTLTRRWALLVEGSGRMNYEAKRTGALGGVPIPIPQGQLLYHVLTVSLSHAPILCFLAVHSLTMVGDNYMYHL